MAQMTHHVLRAPWTPWPHYEPDEIAAVERVLTSGKVNQWTGQEVFSFEREYAAFLGRDHAVGPGH